MDKLKLIAFDAEDLGVISAHLQDAVLKVADLAYLPKEKRFAAVANRFDWLNSARPGGTAKATHERRRCGIRFERVLAAQVSGLSLDSKRDVLNLLAIGFEEAELPGGVVTLHFSGGGAIRLEVECIEAELRDLGAAWQAKSRPEHPDDDSGPSS